MTQFVAHNNDDTGCDPQPSGVALADPSLHSHSRPAQCSRSNSAIFKSHRGTAVRATSLSGEPGEVEGVSETQIEMRLGKIGIGEGNVALNVSHRPPSSPLLPARWLSAYSIRAILLMLSFLVIGLIVSNLVLSL